MELIARNENKGKTFYHPVQARCKGTSQYNRDTEYYFDGLNGFWDIGRNAALTVGRMYDLELATKPKSGNNAGDGAMYQDIMRATPVVGEDSPEAEDSPEKKDAHVAYQKPPEAEDSTPDEPYNHGLPDVRGDIQGHLEKIAADIVDRRYGIPLADDEITLGSYVAEIVRTRDFLYWHMKEIKIAPPHYCREHRSPRHQSKNDWAHSFQGGWCQEQGGIIPPPEPAPDQSVDAFRRSQPPQEREPNAPPMAGALRQQFDQEQAQMLDTRPTSEGH